MCTVYKCIVNLQMLIYDMRRKYIYSDVNIYIYKKKKLIDRNTVFHYCFLKNV